MIIIVFMALIIAGIYKSYQEGFTSTSTSTTTAITSYKNSSAYGTQLSLLGSMYDTNSNGKQSVIDELANGNISVQMTPVQQCLVNFFCLGCRFTGYMGPFSNGFFDADVATRYACSAGCRVFVLEIDYTDGCVGPDNQPIYFPKLAIRDIQGRNVVRGDSYQPQCNTLANSNIQDVCTAINTYAFAHSNPGANDPVIIVIYLLRTPPINKLDYMSNIAKTLNPLIPRHIDNIISGGTFTRQKQEGKLLTNPITDYQGRVLFFSNADTTPFRDAFGYAPNEDLDYLVNLRLTYKQSKLGSTCSSAGGSYGLLEPAEDYLVIPPDQADTVASDTKLKWTICLSQDPSVPVSETTYTSITGTYGVHCVPIQLWDTNNSFMFTENTFQTYSFIPKPVPLQYVKPPIAVPAQPSPQTNANGGSLRQPVIQG